MSMSDELVLFEFLECDLEENASLKKRRRMIRTECNPFDISDSEFIRRYRLSKELAVDLCEELRPMFMEPMRSADIDLETKVLTALSFFGTGSYQRPIGNIGAHSMAQQTVSSVIAQITTCLNSSAMRNKYIVFPKTLEERNNTRTMFFNKFGIPGVLGCIDCTQVAILRPTQSQREERYYCRKHYHSLNVQLICNADMEITSVDASFGGATHDSFIWNAHPIKTYLERLNETTWLLGDSGYPLRKYMMTPFLDAEDGTPESRYTNLHVRTRNVIERTIGLLKARFRCLLSHRVLHYSPEVAASIVNACVILHNICNSAKLPEIELENSDELQEARMQFAPENSIDLNTNNPELQLGILTRQHLVQRLWSMRPH